MGQLSSHMTELFRIAGSEHASIDFEESAGKESEFVVASGNFATSRHSRHVLDVFGQSPAGADNPLLAKRVYVRGNCFEWASWFSANSRQGYHSDFQYAKAIFKGYERWSWNYIGPVQLGMGLDQAHDPQPGPVPSGLLHRDDGLDMTDDLWYHFCQNRGQGWGYMHWNPTLVAMIYYDGYPMPGFQPGCNHTDLKTLLRAKMEAEEAAE
ncbi:hypothetical protein BGZ61DRAFT_479769 [Ilyonectria robusta]|uniref:uncharacterized protein n=1 Tax=Ilyonectria robusta TaxID=1079257 RepID=UPI001E8D261D|nr:uncharacterized protein BGZ61DRAFT_479769 [Ilyonectria robusta]KAH8684993.1 hypothetical protein BGZ61DRAFT_479769 [Ilyonectria robusta]